MIQTKRVEPFWQDCGSTPGLFSSRQLHELATVAGVQRGLLSQQPLLLAATLQLISTKATQKQMQLLKASTWSLISDSFYLFTQHFVLFQGPMAKLETFTLPHFYCFFPQYGLCAMKHINEQFQWQILITLSYWALKFTCFYQDVHRWILPLLYGSFKLLNELIHENCDPMSFRYLMWPKGHRVTVFQSGANNSISIQFNYGKKQLPLHLLWS